MARTTTVYLIHLDRPLGHARHYLGSTRNLTEREATHRAGAGSPMLAAATAAGIPWSVVRTWPGGRDRERAMKRRHRNADYCPICGGRCG